MRVLVTGASGQVGATIVRELAQRGDEVICWTHHHDEPIFGCRATPIDLADRDMVCDAFVAMAPEAIVHCGGMTSMKAVLENPQRAARVNIGATIQLAELAEGHDARLIAMSTDMVFGGEHAPYNEQSPPAPTSLYGRTKLAAERPVLDYERGLVFRLALVIGPMLVGKPKFFDKLVEGLRRGDVCTLFHDEWRTPVCTWTIANAVAAALTSDAAGLFHLGGPARLSREEMGRRLARHLDVNDDCIEPISRLDLPTEEPRPRDLALDAAKWRQTFPDCPWPSYKDSLKRMAWQ